MQTELTQGTVTRVATHVPAKYRAPKADRPAVERTLATFGSPTNLPGFKFTVGSKVQTTNGTTEWTVLSQADTPAGTSPRSYRCSAGKMERVFGENALRAVDAPKKLVVVDVALNPASGEIEPVDGIRSGNTLAPLVAEYGPLRLAGTFGSPTYKAPKAAAAPKPATVRANAPFGQADVITLLVDANPKKPGNKNYPWFQAIMDAVAAGGGKCTVAEAVARGSHTGEIKYDVEHKYIKVAKA
jgi:hypothetical protein